MVGFTNRIRDLRKKLRVRWRLAGLATKFLIMAIPPVVCNSLLLGAWVSREVQEGVVQDEAAAGALYVEALLEPVLRRMSSTETASAAAIEALNDLAASKPFRERIANYKVWSLDGRILFSKAPELIGRTYPLGDRLREALTGKVTAEYDELSDEENTWERDLQKPLLEIYVPIRALDTGRVVAVAEIYQFAGELESELRAVRFKTWAIVATLTTAMVGLLFVIVRQGADTITRQRRILVSQVGELSRLLSEVSSLRDSVEKAHKRAAVNTERFLRRVGSDLHDGPAQYIALALLNLDDTDRPHGGEGTAPRKANANVGALLKLTLDELRAISAGLAPPEIDKLSLSDTLGLAARNHEWRSGSSVKTEIGELGDDPPDFVKVNLYRFVQEALNNAFTHGGGIDQTLRAGAENGAIVVEVSDGGPGMAVPSQTEGERPHLGLFIMKDRIEALGGSLAIEARPGAGTRARARIDVSAWKVPDGDGARALR